jgi:pimeloyl-ACP methyl ester carboxylesterase
MNALSTQAVRSAQIASGVAQVHARRLQLAGERFAGRMEQLRAKYAPQAAALLGLDPLSFSHAAIDAAQRGILFWDTLRQRGNRFLEHERQGKPPVLHFDYETVLDGRRRARPVNYALLRIVPPEGVKVAKDRRPYVIIDPRAGHGPGIGGMKDDSQVGVALRDGHPVYFVAFFPDPEPGQTLLDVCEAEAEFIAKVRALHPQAAKPVVIGNCQGGWAAMMLAAANPDDVGPIVINGAPMSYWGGAWSEGEGDNPMRYAGGNLGGTWLASFVSDLGDGVFDGAHLVENFENLNPANTFWDKYYNLYANVDTEAPRFLDFERWWGGFYLMNREEIEWITGNLFVGNRLWKGEVKDGAGRLFDLRELRSPVVLFASMGDNITPPQQAFNWVADVYRSTDEIKERGQVIVGLVHESVGHLGIFVSGKVAKKEYTQIVSVLKSIEALAPGLYAMKIDEVTGRDGKASYHVSFEERRLEDVVAKLNRFERNDEQPFEAARAVSDFNQQAYELFARPLVQALANPLAAHASRQLHPLRLQRWAVSDLNPFLWWLKPAAEAVKAQRRAVPRDDPARAAESLAAELLSASLDLYRDLRDAQSEQQFFRTYGNLLHLAPPKAGRAQPAKDASRALAVVEQGGYPEAVARCAHLLARRGEPLALEDLETKAELMKDYAELLPAMPRDQARRVRGAQAAIVEREPQRALETLPSLVRHAPDRERLLELLTRLVADPRVQGRADAKQRAMLGRIRAVLERPGRPARAAKRRAAAGAGGHK